MVSTFQDLKGALITCQSLLNQNAVRDSLSLLHAIVSRLHIGHLILPFWSSCQHHHTCAIYLLGFHPLSLSTAYRLAGPTLAWLSCSEVMSAPSNIASSSRASRKSAPCRL